MFSARRFASTGSSSGNLANWMPRSGLQQTSMPVIGFVNSASTAGYWPLSAFHSIEARIPLSAVAEWTD